MKLARYTRYLILICCCVWLFRNSYLCFAQQYAGQKITSFSVAQADLGINLVSSPITQHTIKWSPTGTVSTCTVALDSSVDGISWSAGAVIAGQTCTSAGSVAVVSSTVNYVRMKVTVFSGTGSVTVTWTGYGTGGPVVIPNLDVTGATALTTFGPSSAPVIVRLTNGILQIVTNTGGINTGYIGLGHSIRTPGRAQLHLIPFSDASGDQTSEIGFYKSGSDGSTENDMLWTLDSRYNTRVGGHDGNYRFQIWEGIANAIGAWTPRFTIYPGTGNTLIGGALNDADPHARLEIRATTSTLPLVLLNSDSAGTVILPADDIFWTKIATACTQAGCSSTTLGRVGKDISTVFSENSYFNGTGPGWHQDDAAKSSMAMIFSQTNSNIQFRVSPAGALTDGGHTWLTIGTGGEVAVPAGGYFKYPLIQTTTNCADSAGAAACTAAPAGHFVIDAATTSTVVSTTAVTASSEIILTRDDSLNTLLTVTCNTQSSLVLGTPRVTARNPGVSFTVSIDVAPTTNPMCNGYSVIN